MKKFVITLLVCITFGVMFSSCQSLIAKKSRSPLSGGKSSIEILVIDRQTDKPLSGVDAKIQILQDGQVKEGKFETDNQGKILITDLNGDEVGQATVKHNASNGFISKGFMIKAKKGQKTRYTVKFKGRGSIF